MAEEKDENRGLSWGVLSWPQYFRRPHEIVAAFLYFLLGIVILIVLAISASILLRILWAAFDFQNHTEIRSADDFNKILLGLGGLIGALTAVPFLVWRTMIAQKQNAIAQENIHSTTMATAIEQLGAMKEEKITQDGVDADGKPKSETVTNSKPNIEVRLGAIYLLEKLAREHRDLHWPIMEILCAYVRENAGALKYPDQETIDAYSAGDDATQLQSELLADRKNNLPSLRNDIQAVITVIGRRTITQKKWEQILRDAANKSMNFVLDLSNSNLQKAQMSGLDFEGVSFVKSNLELADMRHANLSMAKCDYAHFEGAFIWEANFSGSIIYGAHLEGIRGEKSLFDNSNLNQASLKNAWLWGASFVGSNLLYAKLNRAQLNEINFSGAILHNAQFEKAILKGSNMKGAGMMDANFALASFSGVDLEDAIMDRASFRNARGLNSDMISKTWGDSKTYLPDGVIKPENERWVDKNDWIQIGIWYERREYWINFALDLSVRS